MYISLYGLNSSNQIVHITNLINVEIDFTARVFDFNNFTAKGISDVDFSDAILYVLNDETGTLFNGITGMVKNVKREDENSNLWSFKGEDFREILDTEVLIDYTQEPLEDYSLNLSDIFNKIVALIPSESFPLPLHFEIPTDTRDTSSMVNYIGTYMIKSAYGFLRPYLSFYNYYIMTYYNPVFNRIDFVFVNAEQQNELEGNLQLKLKDFTYTRTTNDLAVNSAVATMTWNSEKDIGGIKINNPRPSNIPTRTYFIGKDNQIYQSLPALNNRLYPIKTKVFEEEYLANAQFNAVYELANNRFPENIQISTDNIYTPIDLKALNLYTIIQAYDDAGNYKYLPVSEIHYKVNSLKEEITIKLGFKKMLLTQIIKGN